ncbi:MAG: Rrf2 family transcriptional regulator, partial [Tissierellia bacterium]|nr:Rrf2 family transcriptional regulator [Tissierellia bacterium]
SLRKDGLLTSVRGAYGGYMLSRAPDDITVGQVLRALEGEIAPYECVDGTDHNCTRGDDCATKLVLVKIKVSIDQVIDSITLNDMVIDNIEIEE